MYVAAFLDRIRQQPWYDGQLVHVVLLAERPGEYAEPGRPLAEELGALIRARGIEQLYSHQVTALELAREGRDLVVVTGTASGKTLCYNLPILESCLAEPAARALYLFPTKALAQDQLKGLLELLSGVSTACAGADLEFASKGTKSKPKRVKCGGAVSLFDEVDSPAPLDGLARIVPGVF